MSQLLARKAEGTIDLDPSLVCITLQNFGSKAATPFAWGTTEFSFFRDDDKLTGITSEPDVLPYLQPWMQTAVGIFNPTTQHWEGGDATNWMENYLDALAVLLSNTELPPITIPRFHCEVETSLTQGRADNGIVKVMLACEQDTRWATLPVPGFGGATMLDIWQDAQDFYGWRDPVTSQYQTLAAAMHDNERADSPHNKPYFAWWINVCRRALDGAIKITCYDVIDNHPIYGGAKHSNYGFANMDMGQDIFGFRSIDGTSPPTSTWHRGKYFFGGTNAFPQILSATNPPLAWGLEPDCSSADFDAPELYFGASIHESLGLRQRRWYEPADPFTGVQRLETSTECYLRAQRHHLDSVLHTPSRAPDGVNPLDRPA